MKSVRSRVYLRGTHDMFDDLRRELIQLESHNWVVDQLWMPVWNGVDSMHTQIIWMQLEAE